MLLDVGGVLAALGVGLAVFVVVVAVCLVVLRLLTVVLPAPRTGEEPAEEHQASGDDDPAEEPETTPG